MNSQARTLLPFPWVPRGHEPSTSPGRNWRNVTERAVMLSCSKTLVALELPSTLGSQEPVSAYPPYIWLYPTSPGSTQLFCELMETLISGEESCSQKSPASLLCVWAWGGGVQSPGWASWGGPWLLFLVPSQEHRHRPPTPSHPHT